MFGNKHRQMFGAVGLITPHRKFPAEILVYKLNAEPLFRERFWSLPSSSRDPTTIAKTILRQAARSIRGAGRLSEIVREIHPERSVVRCRRTGGPGASFSGAG